MNRDDPGKADGGAHAARSVTAAVRLALRTARLSTLVSGLVPAATAAFLVAALVELDGAGARAGATAIVVLSAVLAALASWTERWPDDRAVVRELDARQHLKGTLVTFWERRTSALQGERFPVLLAERLRPAARGVELARACLPRRPGWLALPCAAAALWFWTLERAPLGAEERSAAVAGVEDAARALLTRTDALRRDPARPASGAAATEVTGAASAADPARAEAARARELAEEAVRLARGAPASDPESDSRLGEIAAALATLAEGPIAPELRPAIERLSRAVEELRDAPPALAADPGRTSASEGGPERAPGTTGAKGPAGAQAPVGELQGARRTEGTPPGAGGDAPAAPDPARAGSADPALSTTAGGAWWDARYDALVSGWIESRRRAP